MSDVICPHCENVEMEHRVHRDTHIYLCPDCPNVMIEYSDGARETKSLRL